MREVAYLFERFPSFGQTFVYREVAELERQGTKSTFTRSGGPVNEPKQDWDPNSSSGDVQYLPEENILVREVDRALREGRISGASAGQRLKKWGRQSDFLRLYQAIYVGLRLQESGVRHVHAHFAGMAARTAYWINQFFGIRYSFTAHANDIFAPRDFVVSLAKLTGDAAAIVTVSDYAAEFAERTVFPTRRESASDLQRSGSRSLPSG